VASLHDELQFHGMSLHAVNVGAVTTMQVGMLGTMAQMFLADLREKTKRGQLGRGLQGRCKAFGYDVVEDAERGGRSINRSEADVVEQVFETAYQRRSRRRFYCGEVFRLLAWLGLAFVRCLGCAAGRTPKTPRGGVSTGGGSLAAGS